MKYEEYEPIFFIPCLMFPTVFLFPRPINMPDNVQGLEYCQAQLVSKFIWTWAELTLSSLFPTVPYQADPANPTFIFQRFSVCIDQATFQEYHMTQVLGDDLIFFWQMEDNIKYIL